MNYNGNDPGFDIGLAEFKDKNSQKERDEFLIENGYYSWEPVSEADTYTQLHGKYVEKRVEPNGLTRYYQKVAYKVTDEQYRQILLANNKIAPAETTSTSTDTVSDYTIPAFYTLAFISYLLAVIVLFTAMSEMSNNFGIRLFSSDLFGMCVNLVISGNICLGFGKLFKHFSTHK